MKERYSCFLNGKFYGSGGLAYMKELFVDYVINHRMYDKDEVDFKIMKKGNKTIEEILSKTYKKSNVIIPKGHISLDED